MPTFSDVPSTSSLYPSVEWVSSQGVMPGITTTTFRPAEAVNRAAVAETLYRLSGSPYHVPPAVSPFPDVPASHRLYKQIHWAWQRELMYVWTGRYFKPAAYFPREASADALFRASASAYKAPAVSPFADVATTRGSYTAVCWMNAVGISTGSVRSGKRYFDPAKNNPRDHWAAFLHRFDQKI